MAAENGVWLRGHSLTKAYGGVLALADASLEIRTGELRGLVGANGAGKSTLVKILTGMVAPTSGEVLVDARRLRLGRPKASLRAGIASVPQELAVAPTMTVAENVMLGHEPRGRLGRLRDGEMRRAASGVLESLSLPIDANTRVGELPLIEQRLVMIARALSFDARLVIFDEPTATVSPLEAELLLQTIRALTERGISVLYVSHHLGEIERICDAVTVLRDGRVVAVLNHEEASHAALVELLVSGAEVRPRGRRSSGPDERTVLSVVDVEGERLGGVELRVRAGEIVGLAGLAGSGARELLLTVAGAVPFRRGRIELDGRALHSGSSVSAVAAGAGFLPGDRSLGTFSGHSVRHNVSLSSLARYALGPFVRFGRERSTVADVLARVELAVRQDTQIAALSGGNQQKALVGRSVASGARLLLLDDPTAGVDVLTRPEIHRQIVALAEEGAGVLLVSTDIDEFVELSDRVVVFERGTVTGELHGADISPARVLAAMTRRAELLPPTHKEDDR